jgi:transmembrane sensor
MTGVLIGRGWWPARVRRKFWLPFRTRGTHIQDEREFYGSPWLRLTKFDVRLEHDATVVTVVEGRVAVGPSPMLGKLGTNSSQDHPPRFVQLSADQQISVTEGAWPATPIAVDSQSATAWLRREIAFDHEPLERVVAEYNRYSQKPIEIATPALRNLQISGVFATDDPEAFVAFLRSLKGVRVEVTETRIRVSRN